MVWTNLAARIRLHDKFEVVHKDCTTVGRRSIPYRRRGLPHSSLSVKDHAICGVLYTDVTVTP